MKIASLIAAIIFGLVSVAHLLRLIFRVQVTICAIAVPIWLSVLGFIFAGALAVWLWLENRPK